MCAVTWARVGVRKDGDFSLLSLWTPVEIPACFFSLAATHEARASYDADTQLSPQKASFGLSFLMRTALYPYSE